jgi:hypothetical protein
MRIAVFAAAAAVVFAGPALAQGPITTAPAAGPSAPQPTAAPPPLRAAGEAHAEEPQVAMGPCGPEKVKADGKLETKPHGEVEAGIGTGGYRHVAGVVCQPIGQNSALTVGVSDTQFDRSRRR